MFNASGLLGRLSDNKDVLISFFVSIVLSSVLVPSIAYFALVNYLVGYNIRPPMEGVEFLDFVAYSNFLLIVIFHVIAFSFGIYSLYSVDLLRPSTRRTAIDFAIVLLATPFIAATFLIVGFFTDPNSISGDIIWSAILLVDAIISYASGLFGEYREIAATVVKRIAAFAACLGVSYILYRWVKKTIGGYAFVPVLIALSSITWLNAFVFAGILNWAKYGGGVRVEVSAFAGQAVCDVKIRGKLILRSTTTFMLIDESNSLIEIESKNVCKLSYLDEARPWAKFDKLLTERRAHWDRYMLDWRLSVAERLKGRSRDN